MGGGPRGPGPEIVNRGPRSGPPSGGYGGGSGGPSGGYRSPRPPTLPNPFDTEPMEGIKPERENRRRTKPDKKRRAGPAGWEEADPSAARPTSRDRRSSGKNWRDYTEFDEDE